MELLGDGVWEGFIPGLTQYDNYKYAVHTADGHVLAYRRTWEGETVLVAVNTGDQAVTLDLPWPARDVLSGEVLPTPGTHALTAPLPPRTGRVLIPITRFQG